MSIKGYQILRDLFSVPRRNLKSLFCDTWLKKNKGCIRMKTCIDRVSQLWFSSVDSEDRDTVCRDLRGNGI